MQMFRQVLFPAGTKVGIPNYIVSLPLTKKHPWQTFQVTSMSTGSWLKSLEILCMAMQVWSKGLLSPQHKRAAAVPQAKQSAQKNRTRACEDYHIFRYLLLDSCLGCPWERSVVPERGLHPLEGCRGKHL